MVVCNHDICYCGKTWTLVLLQELRKQDCPCLREGFLLILPLFISFLLRGLNSIFPSYMTSLNANYQDHYFDVVTNVVGLVAAVVANRFYWWIDPAGAIVLAIYTITNWSGTVMENAGNFSSFS